MAKWQLPPSYLMNPQNLCTRDSLFENAQKSSIDNVTNGARFCPGFNCGSGFAAAAALLICQLTLGVGVTKEEKEKMGESNEDLLFLFLDPILLLPFLQRSNSLLIQQDLSLLLRFLLFNLFLFCPDSFFIFLLTKRLTCSRMYTKS
jgi:hypothetical protein